MLKRIIILIVLLLLLGVAYELQPEKKAEKKIVTNGDMLATPTAVPLIKENVPYFPNANGYFVRPAAEAVYPGVVLIHENRGLNAGIKTMADELAKEGYMVLAVDLLGPSVETQEEARALTAKFNQATGIANMRAAVQYLQGKGAIKIASLGWCFGGAQSLQLALSGEKMDATMIYYGRLATTTTELAPISWPVFGVFGDQDQSISVESVDEFKAALNTLGIENEIYMYAGVGHAFANPSGANYAPNETKDAWAKTVTFLNEHLK